MQSSQDTAGAPALQSALDEITKIDSQVAELNDKIDALKAKRDALEAVAIKEMNDQRLDGVKASGRNWRVEWTHSFSAADGRKELVLRAAEKAGLRDYVVQINTSRIKQWLTEKAKEAGKDARQPYSDGTEFEGVVGEYVRPVLRSLSVR